MRESPQELAPKSTRPLWLDPGLIAKYSQLAMDISVDVCIIGAGITGLTAAHLLKRSGKTVAVIDLGRIGSGETGHTTAHLTEVFDISYSDLLTKFGLDGARLAAASTRQSIDQIEQTIRELKIDCDFLRVPGFRFADDRSEVGQIEDDSASAAKIGVPHDLVDDVDLPFPVARAIRFSHQAQFHPIKYLAGLARSVHGQGTTIYEDTRMLDIEEGEPCRVITDRGVITATDVFVASNVPSSNRFFLHTKIAAYRTYAIGVRVRDRFDRRGLFWNVKDPYHYIRSVAQDGELNLIIGGEDHKTGQDDHTEHDYRRLIEWAEERFEIDAITHRWSGQVIETVDGLPYIGRNPLSEHVYVATGFSGTGMTFGTISGMIVSDLMLGNQNPCHDLYDASRVKPLAAIKSFLAENIDFPSHMISDRLSRPDAASEKQLREGEGGIVRIGAKKVAAYRDPGGELHLLSPVCPHLGCYVNWNEAEKSWDCPCHGSRFSPVGELLNGPALSDLAEEPHDDQVPLTPERYEPTAEQTVGLNAAPLLSV